MGFQRRDFQFCFTWYPTDITLGLWRHKVIYPRIRTFVEKRFHGRISKKKALKSGGFVSGDFVIVTKLRSIFPQRNTLLTRLLGLLEKRRNLEIWPFLKSGSEFNSWNLIAENPPTGGGSYLQGLKSKTQRGTHSKNLYRVLRGWSSSSGFLIREPGK